MEVNTTFHTVVEFLERNCLDMPTVAQIGGRHPYDFGLALLQARRSFERQEKLEEYLLILLKEQGLVTQDVDTLSVATLNQILRSRLKDIKELNPILHFDPDTLEKCIIDLVELKGGKPAWNYETEAIQRPRPSNGDLLSIGLGGIYRANRAMRQF